MRPKYFTKKQGELLNLIFPGPLGMGLSVSEACERLGITESSGFSRLKHFRARFPEAWKRFEGAREIARKHRIQLSGGARRGYSIEERINNGYDNFILEKF